MPPATRYRLSIGLLIILSFISLTGFGCRQRHAASEKINQKIIMWGLWQDSAMMDPVIRAFKDQTGITVEYKKIASVAEYEKTLLEALAQGRGPDIFVIHHTWVEGKKGLMSPAPAEVVDERAVREEFVDVVASDVIRAGSVYALPTSVDSLALYYNKDILAASGIAQPPRTWEEVQRAVERITSITTVGTIQQSGIALGTGSNINRASDIIQLLMLQSGLPIIDPSSGSARLANEAGGRVLTFYSDFANRAKRVYTWDITQHYSLDAFTEGKTAMMINYSYTLPTVRAKNPRLHFGVAPLPQLTDTPTSKQISFAAYWPFAVSNTSRAPLAAWQFVRFLTSKPIADAIDKAQGVPPARRDSVVESARDPILGVFAEQALVATSWPRIDIVATDAIFVDMLDSVTTGQARLTDALRRAEDRLNQLTKKP